MSNNRTSQSRPQDAITTFIVDGMGDNSAPSRIFHLAQVISSEDDKNGNRLKVRIPLLDDVYYYNDKGKLTEIEGHDKLPWCIPSSNRFIDTPENGSVVLVGLLNPNNPASGRVWFSALTQLNAKDIFDVSKLEEELNNKPWQNAEDSIGVESKSTPELRERPPLKSKKKETNYKTGIRGKNKNKLLFDEEETLLIQNEGKKTEAKLKLTNNVLLMAEELEILSSQSSAKEKPVFADPLFSYLQSELQLLNAIVTLLSISPGISPFLGIPVIPSPAAASLVTMYSNLATKYAELKVKGASKFLKIN